MKRFALLALTGSVFAQVPVAPTPVGAPTAPASTAPAQAVPQNPAPLAPVHDQLVEFNPALPGSFASLLVTPHDYFGERAVAFQWNGGSSSFAGTGLVVTDRLFAGFDVAKGDGVFSGGYTQRTWGAGLRFAFDRGSMTQDSAANSYIKSADTTNPVDGFGVFGSMALKDNMKAYAHIDWYTPVAFLATNRETYTGVGVASLSTSTRADAFALGGGIRSEAKGPRGISWNLALDYANYNLRASGQSADSTHPMHTFHELGQIGKSLVADGFILAGGLDQKFIYANGLGGGPVDANGNGGVSDTANFIGPDWSYWVIIEPTLSVILPIYENWTLKGGTRIGLQYSKYDARLGDKETVHSSLGTTAPTGSLGLRYDRGGRWAAEAQVSNHFLSNGPYFISGAETKDANTNGGLFGSFALTVSFK